MMSAAPDDRARRRRASSLDSPATDCAARISPTPAERAVSNNADAVSPGSVSSVTSCGNSSTITSTGDLSPAARRADIHRRRSASIRSPSRACAASTGESRMIRMSAPGRSHAHPSAPSHASSGASAVPIDCSTRPAD